MIFSNFVMQTLQNHTVGQQYAVDAVTRAITLAYAGLRRRENVLGVLLFIGPSGSGKSHMTRTLARLLTGNEHTMLDVNCLQLDSQTEPLACLEEQLKATNNRIPTGWSSLPVFNLIVFEEIDKASEAFRDELALAIDCGSISMPGGIFSLSNCFVILISNLSRRKADQLAGRTIGFFLDGESPGEMSRRQAVALEEVDNRLGTRLVSRIDEIVVFDPLNQQNIIRLLERQLFEIEKYLAGWCIGFIMEQDAKTFLLREGVDDLNHGARQINRVVRNYLEFPIADLMLSQRLVPGTTVTVKHEQNRSCLNFEIMVPGNEPVERNTVQNLGLLA
jgi:ATP-dependent Clp protease ATP-binding subunit ClpC